MTPRHHTNQTCHPNQHGWLALFNATRQNAKQQHENKNEPRMAAYTSWRRFLLRKSPADTTPISRTIRRPSTVGSTLPHHTHTHAHTETCLTGDEPGHSATNNVLVETIPNRVPGSAASAAPVRVDTLVVTGRDKTCRDNHCLFRETRETRSHERDARPISGPQREAMVTVACSTANLAWYNVTPHSHT